MHHISLILVRQGQSPPFFHEVPLENGVQALLRISEDQDHVQ